MGPAVTARGIWMSSETPDNTPIGPNYSYTTTQARTHRTRRSTPPNATPPIPPLIQRSRCLLVELKLKRHFFRLENVDKHRNSDEETNDEMNNADELDTMDNTNDDTNFDNVNNIGGTGRNDIESNDVRTEENSFDNSIDNNVAPENNNIDNNVEPENNNINNTVEPDSNNIENNSDSDATAKIDIRISFVLCKHTSVWGDPTSPTEEFLRCPSMYGHAKKFGKIKFLH